MNRMARKWAGIVGIFMVCIVVSTARGAHEVNPAIMACEAITQEPIVYEWIENHDLREEEQLLQAAFAAVYNDYKDAMAEKLGGSENLEAYVASVMEAERARLHDIHSKEKVFCIHAKQADKVVGYASFYTTEMPQTMYLHLIGVDASVRKMGIGKKLVFSILEKIPDTKKIVLMVRKVNYKAMDFYQKLGFKQSDFMFKGADPDMLVGFEYVCELAENLEKNISEKVEFCEQPHEEVK